MNDERGGIEPPRRCPTRTFQEPTVTDAERHPGDDAIPGDEPTQQAAATPEHEEATDETDADGASAGDDTGTADDVHGSGAAGAAPPAASIDIEVAAAEDPRTREELLAELYEAEARRDEYLDDLRRARAEFENFRRRTLREGATQRDLGRSDVIAGLLEVLDDLDRTLEAAEDSDVATLSKGVDLVAGKLVHALKGQGLDRIDETGVAFDPNHHEAVQQVEAATSGGEPTVAQILRPGYRVGDRVLRAAMVVVEQ